MLFLYGTRYGRTRIRTVSLNLEWLNTESVMIMMRLYTVIPGIGVGTRGLWGLQPPNILLCIKELTVIKDRYLTVNVIFSILLVDFNVIYLFFKQVTRR